MSGSTESESVAQSRLAAPSTEPFLGDGSGSRIGSIFTSQSAALFGILVLLSAFFSVLRPHAFPRVANILNMATDASILLVLAVGGTFVILTGGIDLSINGVLVFSGVAGAMAMVAVGGDSSGVLLVGLAAAVAAGAGWGALNGFLIAKAKIPALIVTLGTMGMSLGLSLLLTGGVDISDIPDKLVTTVGSGRLGGVPILAMITAVVFVLGCLLLSLTRFGRYTYAVGSSPRGLPAIEHRRDGSPDQGLHARGALSGLAGYLSLARFATTTLGGHTTDNLQVIAGVVIGGASLFGGSGGLMGSLIGIIIPVVLLERLRRTRPSAVLAAGHRGRRSDRRGLFRPAAPSSQRSLRSAVRSPRSGMDCAYSVISGKSAASGNVERPPGTSSRAQVRCRRRRPVSDGGLSNRAGLRCDVIRRGRLGLT